MSRKSEEVAAAAIGGLLGGLGRGLDQRRRNQAFETARADRQRESDRRAETANEERNYRRQKDARAEQRQAQQDAYRRDREGSYLDLAQQREARMSAPAADPHAGLGPVWRAQKGSGISADAVSYARPFFDEAGGDFGKALELAQAARSGIQAELDELGLSPQESQAFGASVSDPTSSFDAMMQSLQGSSQGMSSGDRAARSSRLRQLHSQSKWHDRATGILDYGANSMGQPGAQQQMQPGQQQMPQGPNPQASSQAMAQAPQGPNALPVDSQTAGEFAHWWAIAMNPQAPMELALPAWTYLKQFGLEMPQAMQMQAQGVGLSEDQLMQGLQLLQQAGAGQ